MTLSNPFPLCFCFSVVEVFMLTSTGACTSFPCWRCCWNHVHVLWEIISISKTALLSTCSDSGNIFTLSTCQNTRETLHCTFVTTAHSQLWVVFDGHSNFLAPCIAPSHILQRHSNCINFEIKSPADLFVHLRLNWMVDSSMEWRLPQVAKPFWRQEIGTGRLPNAILGEA